VARELSVPVTTHAGVWKVTGDTGINQMYDNGYMTPGTIYVHAASLSADSYHKIAATGGSVSVSSESECNAGQGYSPTWRLRRYGIPVSLSQDTSVWWSGDIFNAMRATLNTDRAMEHFEAHAEDRTVTNHYLRAEDVVYYGTRGGAKALGLDSVIGSVEAGKKADLVLIKNDNSPVSFPLLHPYGHVVFQAGRGDVHTVLVNGKVVKFDHKLVGVDLAKAKSAIESTIDYLKAEHGPEEWEKGMHPEIPENETLANPYTYREDVSAWKEEE
jgi:5-methylthioadenosine/S-adenosylhomocysteine deaminase